MALSPVSELAVEAHSAVLRLTQELGGGSLTEAVTAKLEQRIGAAAERLGMPRPGVGETVGSAAGQNMRNSMGGGVGPSAEMRELTGAIRDLTVAIRGGGGGAGGGGGIVPSSGGGGGRGGGGGDGGRGWISGGESDWSPRRRGLRRDPLDWAAIERHMEGDVGAPIDLDEMEGGGGRGGRGGGRGGMGGNRFERIGRSLGAFGLLSNGSPYGIMRMMGSLGSAAVGVGGVLAAEGGLNAAARGLNAGQDASLPGYARDRGMAESIPFLGSLITSLHDFSMALSGATERLRSMDEMHSLTLGSIGREGAAQGRINDLNLQGSSYSNYAAAAAGMNVVNMPAIDRSTWGGQREYQLQQRLLPLRTQEEAANAQVRTHAGNIRDIQALIANEERQASGSLQSATTFDQRRNAIGSVTPAQGAVNRWGPIGGPVGIIGGFMDWAFGAPHNIPHNEAANSADTQRQSQVAHTSEAARLHERLVAEGHSEAESRRLSLQFQQQQRQEHLGWMQGMEQESYGTFANFGAMSQFDQRRSLTGLRMLASGNVGGMPHDLLQAALQGNRSFATPIIERFAENSQNGREMAAITGMTRPSDWRTEIDNQQRDIQQHFVQDEQKFADSLQNLVGIINQAVDAIRTRLVAEGFAQQTAVALANASKAR